MEKWSHMIVYFQHVFVWTTNSDMQAARVSTSSPDSFLIVIFSQQIFSFCTYSFIHTNHQFRLHAIDQIQSSHQILQSTLSLKLNIIIDTQYQVKSSNYYSNEENWSKFDILLPFLCVGNCHVPIFDIDKVFHAESRESAIQRQDIAASC